MTKIAMDIQGMSCGHCVGSVRRALAEVDGATVESVTVGSAEVEYDAAKTSEQALVAALASAGYPAHAVAKAS